MKPSGRIIIWLASFALVLLAVPSGSVIASPRFQTEDPDPRIQALLEQMTPEEKVGQLFLVTFQGSDVSQESSLYDLIVNQHIGGVVLNAENDNIALSPDGQPVLWQLNYDLQNAEYQASLGAEISESGSDPSASTFIPLFIAVEQNGGGYPYDQIITGLTELPSPMAIGATWQPDLARQVGEVLGRELSSFGFNLLLGPSLDVSNTPSAENPGDLGVESFGGDPYWVGQTGRAYILGLHAGSQGRMVAIAKHLPGRGGLDQAPDQEIPTVRKSLAQLSQLELLPFFAVSGTAPDEQSVVDGMMISHIRYEGFQGAILPTTRPVSLDPQALGELLALPEFASWRAAGGLLISDELGSRALRRFFDPTESEFTRQMAREIALEAFLAGSDLLYVANFTANSDVDSYPAILSTLTFFAQKYRDDVAFAERVDESVQRILQKKYQLYENFEFETVLPSVQPQTPSPEQNSISFEIGRQAATLLSPSLADLDVSLPTVPDVRTRVVIFTDTQTTKQCSQCPEQQVLPVDALGEALIRFYGPLSGGRLLPERVLSYPASDLAQLLGENGQDTPLADLVEGAEWIIFAMQDISTDRPASLLFHQFLAERTDLIQDRNLIVFAFQSPYYLSATEISKLTAYYGLYSSGPEFVNVAARLLFKELGTPGASPVSIAGIGYDLSTITAPDPGQSIPLFLEHDGHVLPGLDGENSDAADLDLEVGDLVSLWTGVVVDFNGNRVPDGTAVRFELTSIQEGAAVTRETSVTTIDGVAQTTLRIETSGTLEVRGLSGEPAAVSNIIQLQVSGPEGDLVTPITTQLPGETSPAITASPQVTSAPPADVRSQTNLGDWTLALIVSAFTGLFSYQAGAMRGYVRWGVRWGLLALIGGLLVNVYLGFNFPGTQRLVSEGGIWAVVLSVFFGALLGWSLGLLWWLASRNRRA